MLCYNYTMSEINFNPQSIAIVSTTHYPKWYRGELKSIKHTEKIRGDLALETVKKAVELGYKVVIAEGKSTKTFIKNLQAIPEVRVYKRKQLGRGAGKRLALEKASKIPGVNVLVMTELEKVSFITQCIEACITQILENKAEIVVPKRNDVLFKSSYPRYMYNSEVEGNNIYNEALRSNNILPKTISDLDFFFGPRVLVNDRKVVALFKRRYYFSGISLLEKLYDPDQYSNVLMFPIINALKKKLRIVSIEVPFSYPRLQKENEDVGNREMFEEKRSMQRTSILIDLMHFLSFLEKKKTSRMKEKK